MKNRNRIFCLLAILLLCAPFLIPFSASAAPLSGEAENIKWSLEGTTLSIKGKGKMPDFSENKMAPWSHLANQVTRLEIDERITYIGAVSFYEFKFVKEILLTEKVKTVGKMAFAGCQGVRTLNLTSVETIGEYAFSRLSSLETLRLPDTLKTIGKGAFYRCDKILSVQIPKSVNSMGDSVFALCSSLLRADVLCPLKTLPERTFYGCENLSYLSLPSTVKKVPSSALSRCDLLQTVYYDGSAKNREEISQEISSELPDFSVTDFERVPETLPPVSQTDYDTVGNVSVKTETEVMTTPSLEIISTTQTKYPLVNEFEREEKPTDAQISIDVTVKNIEEWDELFPVINEKLVKQGALNRETEKKEPLFINVKLMDGSYLYGDVLKTLAGKNAILCIQTPEGNRWRIDLSLLQGKTFKKRYNMEYAVTAYTAPSKEHTAVIGGATAYKVKFSDQIDFPITVEVYLDPTASRQAASFYEDVWRDGLILLQSVRVSESGTCFYPMGNINKGTEYVIALNVLSISPDEVILPTQDSSENDWLLNYKPITEQYIVTDVRGFMGMTMKQFTFFILFCVLGFILIVGIIVAVIFIVGKKKQKKLFLKNKKREA